jgi:hypothetical protein
MRPSATLRGFVAPGRKLVRALDQPGQGGAFRERHVARRFPKITARRRLGPVQSAAEVDAVEIQLHDLLFTEALLDPAGEKNFQQLAPERFFLERKTVPRQLLSDRAGALPDMAGGEILQRRPDDAGKVVAAVLVELVVFHGDDGVHEIARQLVVRDRLPVLDVDLAEDFVVAIQDDAGGFHLFELREIERLGFFAERGGDVPEINAEPEQGHEGSNDRDVVFRFGKPAAAVEINRRWREKGNWHADGRGLKSYKSYNVTKVTTLRRAATQLPFVTM